MNNKTHLEFTSFVCPQTC